MNGKMRNLLLMSLMVSGLNTQSGSHYEPSERRNENKPIPKGCKKYRYEDGFETIAINQKSADKKHDKWRKNL